MDKQLIYSALLCPDGKVLHSRHRHDYVTHEIGDKQYMLDGGTEYQRYNLNDNQRLISIYSDEPHGVLRLYYYRLGYGKPGTPDYGKELKTTFLALMTDEHLDASIDYLLDKGVKGLHIDVLLAEFAFRKINHIKIPEL